jgi:ATP-dependent 26S proteasome regulatory subunit
MKIQSIMPSVLGYHKSQNTSNQPKKYNSFLTFQAVDKSALKKLPFEKKLARLFTVMKQTDLIVTGQSMKDIQKGLSKTVAHYADSVKRLIFVENKKFGVPLAFTLTEEDDGEYMCVNLGEKNILLSTENSEPSVLHPHEAKSLLEGDVVIGKNDQIVVESSIGNEDMLSAEPGDYEELYNIDNYASKVINFEEIQKGWIKKANTEAFLSLEAKKEKEGPRGKLSFKDVGGMDSVLDELKKSVLYPLKYPFAYHNVAVNKGILLHGKPGTGKTLVAEALAGECKANFYKICGTDLESKWVGESEENWRKLFDNAREEQPSIIFVDEFDAVVKERGRSEGSDHGDKVLNQILSLMSDLEKSDDNVFVIATTNKPEVMDSAMMRSGRFGKQIEIKEPDKKGLTSIFGIHAKNKNVDPELNIELLMDEFVKRHYTGADVKHIVNEAHTNSWMRYGIYEKMEAGTITNRDIADCLIKKEDFDKAISDWDSNKSSKLKKPVGFN